MPKNTVIYIKKKQRSNSLTIGFLFASTTSLPLDTTPHSHKRFTMLIHVFGISVLYHGGTMELTPK